MVFYLDTSALLKRYRTEKGTEVVDRLYRSKEDLLTSEYACVEVASVAVRALRGRVLDADAYEKLMGAFTHDLVKRLLPWPVSSELVWDTFEAVTRYGLRAPDGLQIASAEAVKKYSRGDDEFFFVASDRELLVASRAAGMNALDPQADGAAGILEKLGL